MDRVLGGALGKPCLLATTSAGAPLSTELNWAHDFRPSVTSLIALSFQLKLHRLFRWMPWRTLITRVRTQSRCYVQSRQMGTSVWRTLHPSQTTPPGNQATLTCASQETVCWQTKGLLYPTASCSHVPLIIPPFRMRQAQCAPDAVALTRKIADLRIAVENCILRLKYSRPLCKRLPINTLHGASDVIKVAAALANLCMPLRKWQWKLLARHLVMNLCVRNPD